MDIRSTFHALTSTGILPTAWAASVWKKVLFSRHKAPISAMGWMTPISLLTVMMLTRAVSGRMAALSSSREMSPLDCTGRYVTSKPSSWRCRAESRTHLCSVCVVMMCFFLPDRPKKRATPLRDMLFDSVAPLVKIIALGSAPMREAMCERAVSVAFSVSHPYAWVREWGLP